MIQIIVFSKNRPLQLHGYLMSVLKQWKGEVDEVVVDVIVRNEQPYRTAYGELFDECRDYTPPNVSVKLAFVQETNFAADLQWMVSWRNADLVCFGCDDAVYVAPVDVEALETAFRDPSLLGVSMRLGRTITRGMFGLPMPQPDFLPAVAMEPYYANLDEPTLQWSLHSAPASTDWSYPWEVVGTVYPGDFVRQMVTALTATGVCNTPNQLEHHGAQCWWDHAGARNRYLLRAWETPRLVLPAVNVVQSDFPNGIVGAAELTPEYLLELWNKGVRLDVDEFARQAKKLDTWRIGSLWLSRPKVAA